MQQAPFMKKTQDKCETVPPGQSFNTLYEARRAEMQVKQLKLRLLAHPLISVQGATGTQIEGTGTPLVRKIRYITKMHKHEVPKCTGMYGNLQQVQDIIGNSPKLRKWQLIAKRIVQNSQST